MKASRFSEAQIIAVLREQEAAPRRPKCVGGTGSRTRHSTSMDGSPRGKKVSGPVLTRIDCKHLFGVTTLWCAQMGNPLTLASTSGRPRGPL